LPKAVVAAYEKEIIEMLPLKRILCPTDFSEFSHGAIEKGAQLARHFGAELCVLHVTQNLERTSALTPFHEFTGVDRWQLEPSTLESAKHELGKLIERHHLDGVRVRALVKRGLPADEIVSAADEEKADLIILPTHGLTGWRSHIFGSVAEKVLRLAHCPVLIKRVQKNESLDRDFVDLTTPPRKILCSTDFSEPSFAALQVAGEWAAHFGAELCLIHVVEPLEGPGLILSRETIGKAMQAEATQQLHAVLRERLPQLAAARPMVRKGSAADEIAAAAKEEDSDLVVIAAHGASGWDTFAFRHTAGKLALRLHHQQRAAPDILSHSYSAVAGRGAVAARTRRFRGGA
jgi:nucleotide-binding universal stress UspA family protein